MSLFYFSMAQISSDNAMYKQYKQHLGVFVVFCCVVLDILSSNITASLYQLHSMALKSQRLV